MQKIGITGSIGSGKSTVTRIFANIGVPVYDADSRAKWLMVSSPSIAERIKELFGADAYTGSGELNRSLIASKAFYDKRLLTKLNEVVHPAVFKDFDSWCVEHKHKAYIVKEAALMFESDSYKQLDKVIMVTAPEELRIERSMKRDQMSREAILSRMKNQMSEVEKLTHSQFEIKNDEQHLLIPQVLKVHSLFSSIN